MRRPSSADIEAKLLEEYGVLLNSADAAQVLRYPSANALTKARRKGTLKLPMMRIANRRGWWTTPQELAHYLTALSAGNRPHREEAAQEQS
ncbi:hypothetical protein XSP_003836 [Xanthomonas euroxanthea]|uniref:Uncharacterized protein n=1 Tax=Xanthomonas euroxanthea TaxID=2259622 RepID=A0A8E4G8U7_9XANT|nr:MULTISPECIES: hypothetical protein [Xanthomonas]CAD1796972.1 hypothetical protein XSP_003836 [Xanthomonas euroxanthea]